MPLDFNSSLTQRPFVQQGLHIRPLDLSADISVMHRWFTQERARFWGMQHLAESEVKESYAGLINGGHAMPYMGLRGDKPAFLLECYDPAHDELGQHYTVRTGDMGMHFFVGPPDDVSAVQSGFTRRVFRVLMAFIFERLQARRVVVEPDARNDKVHVLNREMGFNYQGYVRLEKKLAALAFCTRENFVLSQHKEFAE